MNELDKAHKYEFLQREYMRLEKKMMNIPQISLDEQMKQVDATHKILYTSENQVLVNEYKNRMAKIQHEAKISQVM
jgi:hypothetical protein|tara:strand:- start:155 stop:382 length:228 start_codon:yes stop_codon:yes gene_type:complete